MHTSLQKQQGFTLIEILVVIAIIGLLASTVLASMNSARAKARDARRTADAKQIWSALQLFLDKFGCVPVTTGTTCVSNYSQGSDGAGGWDVSNVDGSGSNAGPFMNFLSDQGLIPKVPVDPINSTANRYWFYCYQPGASQQANHPVGPGPVLRYYKEDGTMVELFESMTDCK